MNLDELRAMYDLTGRAFVVTGGSGVLGADIVCALVGVGANVVVLGRRLGASQAVVERATADGGQALAVEGDVLKRDTLIAAAETAIERFGGVDGLVNGAGGNRPAASTSAEVSFFDHSALPGVRPADGRSG
jgi:NAD(P)-dependent dehydrogenase (short-subunit alcohol dehydrogenase family)